MKMAVNKVVYNTEDGEQTLIDLTEDTVTADTLAEGVTAHSASGETIVGTMPLLELPVPVAKGGTGATTANDAAKNLSVPTLLGGTEIPANSDLNTYKNVGSYYCASYANVLTIANVPVESAFTMKVFYANGTSGYIAQEVIDYITGACYYRLYIGYQDSWQSWHSTFTTAKKVPANGGLSGAVPIVNGGTGANTSVGAANSLGVNSLFGGTSIPKNSDLNDYKTVGNYFCYNESFSATYANCPSISEGFTMRVFQPVGTADNIAQELMDYSKGVRYYRRCYVPNGSWTAWQSDYTTAQKPTAADVGAPTLAQYNALLARVEALEARLS